MLPSIKKIILFSLAGFLLSLSAVHAKISESELKSYSSSFLSRVQSDNPEAQDRISRYLNGVLKEGGAGIRLIDKLGLFLYDCSRNGIKLKKVRFFSRHEIFALLIIMEEHKEEQIYNLYLEYSFDQGKCILQDIYFSVVFEEKMKHLRKFFEFR